MRRVLAAADQRRIAISEKRAALLLEYGSTPASAMQCDDNSDEDGVATVQPPRIPAARLSRTRRLCLLALGSLSGGIVHAGMRSGAFGSEDVSQLTSESVVALCGTPPHRKHERRRH